jgi:hypothetical protein
MLLLMRVASLLLLLDAVVVDVDGVTTFLEGGNAAEG